MFLDIKRRNFVPPFCFFYKFPNLEFSLGVSWSRRFLKWSLFTKKSISISCFFTDLFQSRSILCFVISLACVQSECLMMLSLSIGKCFIKYSTRSVNAINWWILYDPNPTTSIQRNAVFTLSTPPREPFQACRKISFGSPIFQISPFSQITKWTLAFAGPLDR